MPLRIYTVNVGPYIGIIEWNNPRMTLEQYREISNWLFNYSNF
jgi:hypothetical protein